MIRRNLPLALVVLAMALSVPAAAVVAGPANVDARAPTKVDSCTTIDQPGKYVLTSDVENGGSTAISESCIEIRADDVTFDCGGHTLDGRGVSHTKGITVEAKNVTVRNVAVDDWHYGVWVVNGSATVTDVHSFSNAYGIRLQNAKGSTVTNATVENNLIGIYADSGTGLTVENNDVSENQIGVRYADRERA